MKKTHKFLKIFFAIIVISLSQTAQSQNYIKLTGTTIAVNMKGTEAAALDGDIATSAEGDQNGAAVGLDLGALTKVTKLRYYPRADQLGRMTGGKFQGSNDNSIYTDFYTVDSQPQAEWYEVLVDADYRYVRYMSPNGGYCNVAEVEFYQTEGVGPTVYSVASVSLEFPTYTLNVGKTVQVNHTILPANATNKAYTYSISPSGLASIDNLTGILTGSAVGTGTITVTTEDGSKTATSSLTVNAATEIKLTGTVISNIGNGGVAFDGNLTTWPDNSLVGAYAGLDLGSIKNINKIRFYPRPSWTGRMTNGVFQGSNNDVDYTDIYTISTQPNDGVWTEVAVDVNYRYVKYVSPDSPNKGYCNVAEIEFWSNVASVSTALAQPNLMKVNMYPNPVNDRLYLSVNADKIVVAGIDGKEVLISRGSNVDLTSLTKGIYLVKYFVGENFGISKIIKQ